ncbi:MAG: choice-of-anchor Q domain-containing protein [Kofleriaceae bacterium]
MKRVVKLLSGEISLGSSTVSLYGAPIIDGTNTLIGSSSRPVFSLSGRATLESVRLSSESPYSEIVSIVAGGSLRLSHATIESGQLRIAAGVLELTDSSLNNGNMDCEHGTVLVTRARIERSTIDANSCMLDITRSRLGPAASGAPPLVASVVAGGGKVTIENNIFVETTEMYSAVRLLGLSVDSSFRFNTLVSSAIVTTSAPAVQCTEGLEVTSNIIAYNTSSPITCVAQYSLFDAAGAGEVSRGIGNISGEIATFFVDGPGGDFHLAPDSPAIEGGVPGLVTTDFDGNPRPLPLGTRPDVGAYESPY